MQKKDITLRSGLGLARGHGAAHSGTHHWIAIRLSALALIPLCVWAVFAAPQFLRDPSDYAGLIDFMAHPCRAIGLLLFIVASFHHAMLGLQTVIEDYVHCACAKTTFLVLNRVGFIGLGLACVYALLRITFTA